MAEFSRALDLSSTEPEAVMGPHREQSAHEKEGFMKDALDRAREQILALGDIPDQLRALHSMTVDELADKYRDLFGEPTRSRNKAYLQKRLAWRIQEAGYGGLSPHALKRIKQIGGVMPERWRMRDGVPTPAPAPVTELPPAPLPPSTRDPRIPPPGTVLRRTVDDTVHAVTVTPHGFEYAGERFKSLSAIAFRITGKRWNGYLFFGLSKRKKGQE